MSEGALVYPPICLMSGDRIRPAELCCAVRVCKAPRAHKLKSRPFSFLPVHDIATELLLLCIPFNQYMLQLDN